MIRDGITLRECIAARTPRSHRRLHLMALSCIGFQPRDVIHVVPSLDSISDVIASFGLPSVGHPAMATVVVQDRPRETELLTQLSRLKQGNRILVFNDESDIENMPERCFEIVTACVFDHESKRVLRVFDGYKPRKIPSYIDVELNDISDSALAINASRIAALR